MSALLTWYRGLEARERGVLTLGGVLAGVLLTYFLIVEPFALHRQKMAQRVAELERGVAWMTTAAATLDSTGAAPASQIDRGTQSLLALVDQTVRTHNLSGSLRRGEPGPTGEVRLWFEAVPFNDLINWLIAIDGSYGISVSEFIADRAAENGQVDARVTVRDRS